jgi:hypothetical protein
MNECYKIDILDHIDWVRCISKSVVFFWCYDMVFMFLGTNNIEKLDLVLFLKYILPHVTDINSLHHLSEDGFQQIKCGNTE